VLVWPGFCSLSLTMHTTCINIIAHCVMLLCLYCLCFVHPLQLSNLYGHKCIFMSIDQAKTSLIMVSVNKRTEYIGKAQYFWGKIVICLMLSNHQAGMTNWCNLSICVVQENNCHEMFSSQEQCYFILHYNKKLSNHCYPFVFVIGVPVCELKSLFVVFTPSLYTLVEMFDLPPSVVHSTISKMIINEELRVCDIVSHLIILLNYYHYHYYYFIL